MKHLILLILSLTAISFTSVFCQINSECLQHIKTGTFIHSDESGKTIVVRNEKTQTEHQPNDGGTIVSKVKWISDDEYVLTIKKLINIGPSVVKKGAKMRVKITDCSESSYTCTVYYENIYFEGIKYAIKK